MTGPELVDMLKAQSGTQNSNLFDTDYYDALSRAQVDVLLEFQNHNPNIKRLSVRYATNLVADQDRYDGFPLSVTDVARVKYKDKYVTADIVDSYMEKQTAMSYSEDHPLLEIIANSVIIYPTPKEDVVRGIIVEGKSDEIQKITESTEEVLYGKLPNYDTLIVTAAVPYVLRTKKASLDEIREAEDFKTTEIKKAARRLKDEHTGPWQRTIDVGFAAYSLADLIADSKNKENFL